MVSDLRLWQGSVRLIQKASATSIGAAVDAETSVLVISIDFIFIVTSKTKARAKPHIVMFDKDSGTTQVYRTRKKEVAGWIVDAIVKKPGNAWIREQQTMHQARQRIVFLGSPLSSERKRNAPTIPLDVPGRD